MFLLRRPDRPVISQFLARQADSPFSYREVGATRSVPPSNYTIDRYRHRLGQGDAAFGRAAAAIRSWTMFETGWTYLCWPDAPIVEGVVVCSLIRHLGIWSLNACRIVYVFDDQDVAGDGILRYGFAYGTLTDHAERGEERFGVEYHAANESVWYDVVAFSQPAQPLARIGFPIARALQKRFRRDSIAAMVRAVSSTG